MAAFLNAVPCRCSTGVWFAAAGLLGTESDDEHMRRDAESLGQVESGRADAIVRCYAWSEPSVTIGRLQDEDAVRREFGPLPLYRRPTGGRAVLHGSDLTVSLAASYSLRMPSIQFEGCSTAVTPIKRGVMADYFSVTEPLRRALALCGIRTQYGRNAVQYSCRSSRQVQDCLRSSAACDIVDSLTQVKRVGSAMKRGRAGFLVQMSVRSASDFDPRSPEFERELQNQYARCLSIEQWDFPPR